MMMSGIHINQHPTSRIGFLGRMASKTLVDVQFKKGGFELNMTHPQRKAASLV